jgi:AcrR family transcriptional regulator
MQPAPSRHPSQQAPESLRERKKRLTREAVFAAAQRLFAERGFDGVTVAEIADAANISVKTLFTYISAKEELLFSGGPTVLDAVVAAVGRRRLGQTPLVAAGQALLAAVDDDDPHRGLGAFQRAGNADRAPGRPPRTGGQAADRRPDHGLGPDRHQRRGDRACRQVRRHRHPAP